MPLRVRKETAKKRCVYDYIIIIIFIILILILIIIILIIIILIIILILIILILIIIIIITIITIIIVIIVVICIMVIITCNICLRYCCCRVFIVVVVFFAIFVFFIMKHCKGKMAVVLLIVFLFSLPLPFFLWQRKRKYGNHVINEFIAIEMRLSALLYDVAVCTFHISLSSRNDYPLVLFSSSSALPSSLSFSLFSIVLSTVSL